MIVDHGRAVAAGTPDELKRRIGGDVVELHVRDARDVGPAAELLERLRPGAVRIDAPMRRISMRVDTDGDGLVPVVRAVHDAGIAVDDIALRRPHLDEVFLALTGEPAAQAA